MAPQHPALEQGPIGDGVWVIVDPAAGGLREEEVGEWLLENSDTFVSLTSKDGTTSKGVVRLTDDRIMLCEWRRGKRSKLQSKDDSRVGSSTSRAEDPYAMPRDVPPSQQGGGSPSPKSGHDGKKVPRASKARLSAAAAVRDQAANGPPELVALRKLVIERAGQRFPNVKEAFRSLERIVPYRQGAHRVGKHDLQAFFGELGLPAAAAEQMFDAIVAPGMDNIEHKQLVEFFGANIPWPGRAPAPKPQEIEGLPLKPGQEGGPPAMGNQMKVGASGDEAFWRVREMALKRMLSRYKNLRQAFRALDENSDNEISLGEMRAFFRQLSVPQDMADRIFTEMDTDGNGTIDYTEFQDFFGEAFQPGSGAYHPSHTKINRRGSVDRIHSSKRTEQLLPAHMKEGEAISDEAFSQISEMLLQKLATRYTNVRDAFHMFDRNRDQMIDIEEMRVVFQEMDLPEAAADRLFAMIDTKGKGYVTYLKFMDWAGPAINPGQWRRTRKSSVAPADVAGLQAPGDFGDEDGEEEEEEDEAGDYPWKPSPSQLPMIQKSRSFPHLTHGGGQLANMIDSRTFVYMGGMQRRQRRTQTDGFPRSSYGTHFKAPEPRRMMPMPRPPKPSEFSQTYSPSGYLQGGHYG